MCVHYSLYDFRLCVCCVLCVWCSVSVQSDGMESLVTLSEGDMRRALNILQVYNSRPQLPIAILIFSSTEWVNVFWKDFQDFHFFFVCLQSTAVAFGEVNEHNVYLCTGQPLPTDISKIVEWMLNENFSTAYQSMSILYYSCSGSTVKPLYIITDTNGAEESVLYREVSSFQGLKCIESGSWGGKRCPFREVSSVQGCPYRGVPLYMYMCIHTHE